MPYTHTAFGHAPPQEMKLRCIYVHSLPPSERCEFVRNSFCDEESELFMYHYFLFCSLPNPSFDDLFVILYIIAMILWFLVLFTILAVIVDEYFCPAIGTLSKILHLSESLSGVTLLALGNNMPDILAAVTSSDTGNTIIMYNQVLGGSMFVSCVVTACVAISRPFYVQEYFFVRDLSFALGSVVWIVITTEDEKVVLWEACSYILIYVGYLVIVIGGYLLQEKIRWRVQEQEVDWTELRRRRTTTDIEDDGDDEIGFFVEEKISNESVEIDDEPDSGRKLFRDFYISVNPIDDNWKELSSFNKICFAIKVPFLFMLNLLVPVVSAGIKRRGWSKLLNCFHCIVYPFIVIFATGLYSIFGLRCFLYAAPIGFIAAILIFFTSKQNTPPPYHNVFAILSFTMGILIIFTVVKELVALLNLFGTLCQVSPQMLGMTVLSWGNSLGDAVACIEIAKQGFQRMAFAACFAGVIVNITLSMGASFLMRNLLTPVLNEARSGVMGPNCSVFLMIGLTFSIVYIFFTKFQARKSYGVFLIILYTEFLLFCILCETELIHPLGTDHDFSFEMYGNTTQRLMLYSRYNITKKKLV